MDLAERIARRRNRRIEDQLVVDRDALNPTVHLPEPVGREALFEALLDVLDPVFDETLPPNAYVWGPAGAGKSAIVTALISALEGELSSRQSMYTATRGESERSDVRFVYVDARKAASRFRIYRQVLDAVRTESVPSRGVGTDELRGQLEAELATSKRMLVAVDHLGEPDTIDIDEIHEFFAPFTGVAWIGVGRRPPEELPMPLPEEQVHVPQYSYELVDILTVRGTRGLSRTLDHAHARQLAEWADGDAHDALAALFLAAVDAEEGGALRLRTEDIDAGMDAVPRNGVPIGRALALSDNEQLVLRRLLDLALERDRCIDDAAEDIAAASDLTSNTVTRLLYELAQVDVLERVAVSGGPTVVGRQPSKVTPNFSARLFEYLYDS